MKSILGFMALMVLLGFPTASCLSGTEVTAEPSISEPTTVTGEVVMVAGAFYLRQDDKGRQVLDFEDEFYVVRGETGNEVRVYVSEDTKEDLDRWVSPGVKIEAAVSPEGYAIEIKPAQ
jgi:hypothetical protein